MKKILWHNLKIGEVYKLLESSEAGLTTQQVKSKLATFGLNKLPEEKKETGEKILLNQFKSPLVYVLLGAALITFLLADFVGFWVIMLAVFINTVLGFYQEQKANRAIDFLKKLVSLEAKVLRDGNEEKIPVKHLVPGDIIFIEAGDKVPADCRIITQENLQVIEAALTGESIPSKKTSAVLEKGAALADRENMIFNSTVVAAGRAKAIVIATGLNSELGQISKLLSETKEGKTPLQQQLEHFSRQLTYIVLAIAGLIVVIGAIQGRVVFGFGALAHEGMLNIAAAIAVSAIPEGLLVSVTAVLAIGMRAILKEKALVRRLVAAETLGSVSVICSDKTGTLTEGRMELVQVITAEDRVANRGEMKYQSGGRLQNHDLILKISALCNNAVISNPDDNFEKTEVIGTPTEAALLLGAVQSEIPYKQLQKNQKRLAEIPFDSKIKYMATLHRLDESKNVIYIKGAPEKILEMSKKVRLQGKKVSLSSTKIADLKKTQEKLTSQGLRILALAYKQVTPDKTELQNEDLNDLIFLGFVAIKDPLRKEIKETFQLTRQAGIRPVIVTGDHKLTAKAILIELGIKVKDSSIMEGSELDEITDEELRQKVWQIDIFARVEPKHKLRIINAWQKNGEVVAMTGDGINDAPALKAADIGIALGSGTDVAKETSDMILLDNNFRTIYYAIERGRAIFENIRKIVLYLMANSFSEVILILGALAMGLPLPLLPAHIIWINLVTDGFPSLALIFESKEKEVMKDQPRKKFEKVLNQEMKVLIFIIAIVTDFILLGVFYYLTHFTSYALADVRTFLFAVLGVTSLFYVFSARSLKKSIFNKNPFSNHFVVIGVIVGFGLQLMAIYLPFFQNIFETVPLSKNAWLAVIILALVKVLLIEITKFYFIVKNNSTTSRKLLEKMV